VTTKTPKGGDVDEARATVAEPAPPAPPQVTADDDRTWITTTAPAGEDRDRQAALIMTTALAGTVDVIGSPEIVSETATTRTWRTQVRPRPETARVAD